MTAEVAVPAHVQRGIKKQKRKLKLEQQAGVVPEAAAPVSAMSKKQRVEEVTLAAREVMLERLAGDLGFSVSDAEWERLVQLTQQHPRFEQLFAFPSDSEPGWVKPKAVKTKKKHLKIVAIDCEMCVTVPIDGTRLPGQRVSNALCRVSAVDGEDMLRSVISDFIVHQPEPGMRLADPKTDIHGITPEMIAQSKISVEKAQKKMLKYISSDTIIVGHSVYGDLASMRIDHRRVIDTALIYQRKEGSASRRTPGLRDLSKFLLKFEMPDGHDSTIDAQASMLAAKYAVRNPAGSIIPSALELHGPRAPRERLSRVQSTLLAYGGQTGLVATAFQLGGEALSSPSSSPPPVNSDSIVELHTIGTAHGSDQSNSSAMTINAASAPVVAASRFGSEAAIARSCRLRVHRIPKGITSSDIEKYFVETTKIVPTAVEKIAWLPAKNRGSCNLTFATNAHAALAFECAKGKGKVTTDSVGRAQKTIAIVNAKGKSFKSIQLGVM